MTPYFKVISDEKATVKQIVVDWRTGKRDFFYVRPEHAGTPIPARPAQSIIDPVKLAQAKADTNAMLSRIGSKCRV